MLRDQALPCTKHLANFADRLIAVDEKTKNRQPVRASQRAEQVGRTARRLLQ